MKTGITVPCTKRIESCRETRKETYTKWNKVLGCLSYTLCVYVVVAVSSTAHFGSVESMHISAAIEQMIHAYILWNREKKYAKFRALLSGEKLRILRGAIRILKCIRFISTYWRTVFPYASMECIQSKNISFRWDLFIMNWIDRICLFLFSFCFIFV